MTDPHLTGYDRISPEWHGHTNIYAHKQTHYGSVVSILETHYSNKQPFLVKKCFTRVFPGGRCYRSKHLFNNYPLCTQKKGILHKSLN